MFDFSLAVVHHLAVFSLLAIVVAELSLVRRGMNAATLATVARIDLAYGALAAIALAVGVVRAVYAAKGWYFYSNNGFFWAKIAIFVVIGLLSVPPTLKFIQWRKLQHVPHNAQVDALRKYLWAELALFALLPLCAAGMARGYWQFQ
jgi:putative membrane protein